MLGRAQLPMCLTVLYAVHRMMQAFFTWSGVRQTNRLRQRYLAAVLRQDVGFFDTAATTGTCPPQACSYIVLQLGSRHAWTMQA